MSPTSWDECDLSGTATVTLMGVSVWPVTASQWGAIPGVATAYAECSVANPSYVEKTSTDPVWVEVTE